MIRRPIEREMARTAVIAGTATALGGQEERYEQAEYAQAAPVPEAEAAPEPAAPARPSPQPSSS